MKPLNFEYLNMMSKCLNLDYQYWNYKGLHLGLYVFMHTPKDLLVPYLEYKLPSWPLFSCFTESDWGMDITFLELLMTEFYCRAPQYRAEWLHLLRSLKTKQQAEWFIDKYKFPDDLTKLVVNVFPDVYEVVLAKCPDVAKYVYCNTKRKWFSRSLRTLDVIGERKNDLLAHLNNNTNGIGIFSTNAEDKPYLRILCENYSVTCEQLKTKGWRSELLRNDNKLNNMEESWDQTGSLSLEESILTESLHWGLLYNYKEYFIDFFKTSTNLYMILARHSQLQAALNIIKIINGTPCEFNLPKWLVVTNQPDGRWLLRTIEQRKRSTLDGHTISKVLLDWESKLLDYVRAHPVSCNLADWFKIE